MYICYSFLQPSTHVLLDPPLSTPPKSYPSSLQEGRTRNRLGEGPPSRVPNYDGEDDVTVLTGDPLTRVNSWTEDGFNHYFFRILDAGKKFSNTSFSMYKENTTLDLEIF